MTKEENKTEIYGEDRYGRLYITEDYSVYWKTKSGIEHFIGIYRNEDIARGVLIGFKTGLTFNA